MPVGLWTKGREDSTFKVSLMYGFPLYAFFLFIPKNQSHYAMWKDPSAWAVIMDAQVLFTFSV